jgi:hypothetical protein
VSQFVGFRSAKAEPFAERKATIQHSDTRAARLVDRFSTPHENNLATPFVRKFNDRFACARAMGPLLMQRKILLAKAGTAAYNLLFSEL